MSLLLQEINNNLQVYQHLFCELFNLWIVFELSSLPAPASAQCLSCVKRSVEANNEYEHWLALWIEILQRQVFTWRLEAEESLSSHQQRKGMNREQVQCSAL